MRKCIGLAGAGAGNDQEGRGLIKVNASMLDRAPLLRIPPPSEAVEAVGRSTGIIRRGLGIRLLQKWRLEGPSICPI